MNITRLPSTNTDRRWSPAEILSIKDPCDTGAIQKERAGKSAAVAIAKQAPGRAKKKAAMKSQIVEILKTGDLQTVRGLARQLGDISTNTVALYLRELEGEGLACRKGAVWMGAEE